jgi:hypothetical protein
MAITKWWGYDGGYWLPVRWGVELREGVPAIQGCLRGVKWTLSVLRAAVRNSSVCHVVPVFVKRCHCVLRR